MIRRSCRCCGEVGAMVVRFSKWFQSVFLRLYMAYNVISCQKLAKTLKFCKSLISLYSYNLGSRAQK